MASASGVSETDSPTKPYDIPGRPRPLMPCADRDDPDSWLDKQEFVCDTPRGPFEYVTSRDAQTCRWSKREAGGYSSGSGGVGGAPILAQGILKFDRERSIPDIHGQPTHMGHYTQAWELYRALCGSVPKIVLDCASGVGYGGAMLAALGHCGALGSTRVIGVDVCEETIAYATARYGEAWPHPDDLVSFQVGDVRELKDIDDHSIDLYVSSETFEHIPFEDTYLFVEQAARVLRPGGLLFVTTPNERPIEFQSPYHYREYRGQEFIRLLAHPSFGPPAVEGLGKREDGQAVTWIGSMLRMP